MPENNHHITAIIVDDEQSARDILSNLLARFCPEICILESHSNLTDGVEAIKRLQPQIVFLDIEMPNYAGYEIVHFFDEMPFDIIFITAYDKYALRAFEISAVDYLLKPIEVERLKASIQKLGDKLRVQTESEQYKLLSQTLKKNEVKSIVVNVSGYRKAIDVCDIIAIEANESYSLIHISAEHYIVSKNLKHFENVLQDVPAFTRIHKSWIINLNQMIGYSKSKLDVKMTNGIVAKLSKYRKADFEELLA